VVRSQKNNRKTWKWTTPIKRVRIRPTHSATVAFSLQEDKDGTKQKQTKIHLNYAGLNTSTSRI